MHERGFPVKQKIHPQDFIVLIAGLALAAWLLGAPPTWIIVGVVVLLGGAVWLEYHKRWLPLVWFFGIALIGVLMWGGVPGLRYVENERWGGLILTLLLGAARDHAATRVAVQEAVADGRAVRARDLDCRRQRAGDLDSLNVHLRVGQPQGERGLLRFISLVPLYNSCASEAELDGIVRVYLSADSEAGPYSEKDSSITMSG